MGIRSWLKIFNWLLAMVGTFFLIYFLMRDAYEEEQEYQKKMQVYLKSDAIMAMEKAKTHLELNQFEEAQYQLSFALRADPGNNNIRLEVARAYKKQCIVENIGCEDALLIYNLLIDRYDMDVKMIRERLELHRFIGDSTGIETDKSLLRKIELQNDQVRR